MTTKQEFPSTTAKLPAHAHELYREAYQRARERGRDESASDRLGWAAVSRSYEIVNAEWVPRDRDW